MLNIGNELIDYCRLGFPDPSNTLVVVGMSGGVDSSVTAALMHKAGFKVVGVTLKLGKAEKNIKSCCSDQDLKDAADVALHMGFPHYTLDYHSNFTEHVINDFIQEYSSGYTPSPCVRCNQHIKFGDLLKFARKLGAKAVATGHYIKHAFNEKHEIEFHNSSDAAKDQTYFMCMVPQENMSFIRFPLGILNKTQVREIAKALDLPVANKKDSQDLCFIQDGSYRNMLQNMAQQESKGIIVDLHDNIVGYHDGIENYTVGQRRGIDVRDGPWFVLKIIASENKVVIGRQGDLARKSFFIDSINWMTSSIPERIWAKVRSRHEPVECEIRGNEVILVEETTAIAPGQICAFFSGTKLLGGTRIAG